MRTDLPFLHSLQQGRGKYRDRHVECLGVRWKYRRYGEYGCPTGNTMAFLPQGSIPYQQHVNGVAPRSLAAPSAVARV